MNYAEIARDFQAVRPKLLAEAMRIVGQDDAEDMVQDAYLRIQRGIGNFRGDASFSTWAHAIVRNVSLNFVVRRRRRECSAIEELPEAQLAHADTPEAEVTAAEIYSLVVLGIAALSPRMREIFEARYMRGRSYDEIAAQLDVPVGTIRSNLFRIRANLAEAMEAGQLPEAA